MSCFPWSWSIPTIHKVIIIAVHIMNIVKRPRSAASGKGYHVGAVVVALTIQRIRIKSLVKKSKVILT